MRKTRLTQNASVRSTAVWAAGLAALFFVVLPAAAEHTRFWRQSSYADFEPGTAHGVALRSDGKIVLAPKFAPFADPNLGYLYALRLDSRGNIYAAGGSNAKVVRFDSDGKATTVFDSEELAAQTLVVDKNDNLYIGTSPDGKVYKVTRDGQKSVFFDPKTKYIWDLTLGPDGTLYVATGDTGKIFDVAPNGKSEEFYSGDETHIRTIALDGKGNLLAGTEPNGLLLRIPLAAPAPAAAAKSQAGGRGATSGEHQESGRSAYVLYETPKQEITAMVTDSSGNVYVAGIGEKTRVSSSAQQAFQQQIQQPSAQAAGQGTTITIGPISAPQTPSAAFVPFPALTASSVYRIAPDGSPEEVWSARQSAVFALGLSPDGNVLVGIGNEGAVIQLEANGVFSRLAKTESAQVTAFLRAPSGKVYVATANPGKILALGPELESQGSFESQTFDARIFSHWGRLTWWVDNAAGAGSSAELYIRSGNTSNPEKNWSPWCGPYRDAEGAEVDCPAARFAQWRVVLQGGKGSAPELSWVNLAYLPKNLAPEIDSIAVQDPGIRVPGFAAQGTGGSSTPAQLRLPTTTSFSGTSVPATPQRAPQADSQRFAPAPQAVAQKGFETVLWDADDANDDDLRYTIYFRGEGEKDWKLLKDKLDQKFYSWDTTSMPDGAYYLKIVASDAESNPPGTALEGERESDRFVVDNTPPDITGIAAEPASAAGESSVTLRFRASDATSAVVRAQYSLDAGDWILAVPAGELSDSLQEQYAITLRDMAPGEHTVAVRVYDQFDNVAAAKVTFNAPAGKR
jgi:WD40 repeat protein